MKLIIKNKLVSFGGSSMVTDENEKEKFKVKGKVVSLRKKKKIFDTNGNLLYSVKNKFFHIFHYRAYVRDSSNKVICRVTKKISFKGVYLIDGMKDDMTIVGDILHWDFSIQRNGKEIGRISRKFTVVRDTFSLEVFDDNDAGFLVALVIAIDNIIDNIRD